MRPKRQVLSETRRTQAWLCEKNQYSLPLGTRINYGACFGGYYTAKQKGSSGRYTCKDAKSASKEKKKSKYKSGQKDRYKKKNDRRSSKKGKSGSAKNCIRLSSNRSSQIIKNTCRDKIVVFWCHQSKQRKSQNSKCGRKNKFFQQTKVLAAGGRTSNQYSLPNGARISYGACFGGYSSVKLKGSSRSYSCK